MLIGTEFAVQQLNYLKNLQPNGKVINTSCIISLDSLLSLPDFIMNERILRLIKRIEEITADKIIIQTKNPLHPILYDWQKNTLTDFYERELFERKQLNYPPFSVFIKISLKGKKEKVNEEMKKVVKIFSIWKPAVFPAFIKTVNNQYILHALITVPKEIWYDKTQSKELVSLLLSLPPSVGVNVNPESLL